MSDTFENCTFDDYVHEEIFYLLNMIDGDVKKYFKISSNYLFMSFFRIECGFSLMQMLQLIENTEFINGLRTGRVMVWNKDKRKDLANYIDKEKYKKILGNNNDEN